MNEQLQIVTHGELNNLLTRCARESSVIQSWIVRLIALSETADKPVETMATIQKALVRMKSFSLLASSEAKEYLDTVLRSVTMRLVKINQWRLY